MRKHLANTGIVLLLATSAIGCGSSSPESTESTNRSTTSIPVATTTTAPPAVTKPVNILEMQRLTGENPFARIVYGCSSCTLAQFAAIPVPSGWVKGNPMRLVPKAQLQHAPDLPGEPTAKDFVSELSADEFRLLARVKSGELLGATANGPVAVSQVERFTVFTYEAGTTLHELIDPQGRHYVLFAVVLTLLDDGLDPAEVNAFDKVALLADWKYVSRRLDSPLVVDSGGLANVLTLGEKSLWQRYSPG
jgi:hypothetical protein